MQFCWEKLKFPVIGRIPGPFTLEGGDFIPAGPDLCFIGTGLRTCEGAVKYMMENDLFGTRRVAVVRDIFDRNQDRMHLDCVFNILSFDCCIALETLLGPTNPRRRLVQEWTRNLDGEYRLTQSDVEFSEYLRYQVPFHDGCQATRVPHHSHHGASAAQVRLQLCEHGRLPHPCCAP